MSAVDASRANIEPVSTDDREMHMPGELIYQYALRITQVVEFGASAEAVFSGQTPPPEGARFDLYLEGTVTGPKVEGTVRGVDYLEFRADGRAALHIHAEITTEDGKRIALFADGVAIPEKGSPVFQLRENVTLTSNHADLLWVNQIQIWASGMVDVSTGQVRVKAYAT
jgi:Protein of unknown function (DUF3237)